MRDRKESRATRRVGRTRHSGERAGTFAPSCGIRIFVPVTLSLIVAHLVVFLERGRIRKFLPSSTGVCDFSLHGGMLRIIFSSTIATFMHARVSHLMYDITLLLASGLFLERSMGSLCFAITLPILKVFSQCLWFVVNSQSGMFFRPLITSKCVVGFSPTLFALKVILENGPYVYAWPALPTLIRMSTWVGLFTLYASVPETSATAHVCGILAGYVYVYLNSGQHAFQSAVVTTRKQLLSNVTAARENHSTYKGKSWFQYQNGHCRGKDPHGLRQREDPSSSVGSEYAAVDNLEWLCQSCSRKNGVFLSSCDFCGAPRSLTGQYVPSAPMWQEDDRLGYLQS